MDKEHTNNAVVRDPGTIFLTWDAQAIINKLITEKTSDEIYTIIQWIIQVTNTTTGAREQLTVDPAAGKFYLHALTPDTYYNIRLCQVDSNQEIHTYRDFGTLLTPPSEVSDVSDPDSEWHISAEDFQRIHATDQSYLGSS